MSETRARIREHIDANPGVHFRELTRALDLATGQVQYHLDRLDGVRRESVSGRTHYYDASYDPWERRAIAFLRRETARDVLVALLDRGTAQPAEIADRLDIARSTLEHHLDGLVDSGVVAKRRDGGAVTLSLRRPTATAVLLRRVDPSVTDRLSDRFERLLDSLLEG
ncbi:winged helix-turn-helix transcriptional regulator [Haloarcula salina]|uniref:winged helix-turn-helix transcriptional regulator n=1 Tax=Haloarcula salina TaxID=1429914 RepID=UPI003C6EF3B2